MSKLLKAVALSHMTGLALSSTLKRQANDTLGRTPYMGWSSWVRMTLRYYAR